MNRKSCTWTLSALTLTFAALAAVSACDGGGGGEKPDARCADDVAEYGGAATDEVCMTILDAEDAGTITSGANAATFVVPTNGQMVSSSGASLTFSWTSPIDLNGDTARAPAPGAAAVRVAALDRVLRALDPVSTAWAHEPPITGAVHMLRLTGTAARPAGILHFTTLLHWTLTGQDLVDVQATATPMLLQITSAYVTENRILTPSTDGPFRPATTTQFSIAP